MERIPDHPVIRAMERTGYPKPPRVAHTCSWCDDPIMEGEVCYDLDPYGWCCETCIKSRMTTAEAD